MVDGALRELLRHRNVLDEDLAGKTTMFFSPFSLAILMITRRRPWSFH